MKKINIVIAALAVMMAGVSCNKEQNVPENPVGPEGKTVTINASIPEELTKVALGYTGSALALTWQEGDQIIVSDHNNSGNKQTFTLTSGEGTKNAKFTGTAVSASSFDIQLISNMPSAAGMLSQTQAADGSTAHLGYSATLSGVSSYEDVAFTQAWATSKGGTFTQSGALHVSVTLPDGVAAKVNKVTMKADQDIFGAAGGTMVVNITNPGDAGSDNTFDVFATIPTTGVLLPKDLGILFKFGTTDANHDVYTRYYQTPSALTLAPGQLNLISLTGTNSDKYAGKNDDGTEAHPYLIADKYQLDAMHSLMASGTTKYFKLVDDINMSGLEWIPLNNIVDGTTNKFDSYINFDGNNKTISNLTNKTGVAYPSLFGVLNGTVANLTIDHATIVPGDKKAGVLAGYIGSSDSAVVPNVSYITISNSTVGTSSAKGTNYCGGLAAETALNNTSISHIVVTKTDVYGTLAGGVLGFLNAKGTMNDCSYSNGKVSASARYCGGLLASTGNYESIISDCHVQDAIIDSAADRVGGFIGQEQTKVKISNCDVTGGSVNAATINVGGFAGVAYGSIDDSFVDGTSVSSDNATKDVTVGLGGFVGYLSGKLTKCYSNVSIDQKGSYIGGLVGYMLPGGTINKCFSSGNVTGNYRQIGGLVGGLATAGTFTIQNSYSIGNVQANSYVGGLIGEVLSNITTVTISNCYSSGNVVTTSFGAGGLVGFVSAAAVTFQNCVAWNNSVTASSIGIGNWSTGAVVGVTFPKCTITDCYRNPGMNLTAYWVPSSDYNHPDVSAEHPLVKQDGTETTATSTSKGQDGYPQFPYHGKVEAGKSLSELASTTLGWSSEIWDFSTALPTLK